MSRYILVIVAAALTALAPAAWAQEADFESAAEVPAEQAGAQETFRGRSRIHDPALSPEERRAAREQWETMTPEQRAQIREEHRRRWESMSPEEQARFREQASERREERRARWEAMTPEERARVREEHRRRWESRSPEERERLRERRKERRQLHEGGTGDLGAGQGRGGQV